MELNPQGIAYSVGVTGLNATRTMNVLNLIFKENCTIPFITRYRKEVTGGMDEVQIQSIKDTYEEYLETEKRREFVLKTIKEMEKLTPELEKKILAAKNINEIDDLYAPYKSKRKTKGQKAEEAGLKPLAEDIKNTNLSLQDFSKENAKKYINKEHKIDNFQKAFEGACDILIEEVAHNIEVKNKLRDVYWNEAKIKSVKKKKAEEIEDYEKYKDYFEYEQNIKDLKDPKVAHRFLAIRRGATAKVLSVSIEFSKDEAGKIAFPICFNSNNGLQEILELCTSKAIKNYIHPSLELEIKTELKKLSDESAIKVFGENLKNLLLQPYLGPKTVVGVDPGVRTGCKIAVVDNTGKFLVDTVIYPHPPQNDKSSSKKILEAVIEQFKVEYIAIGNGTFGRETLEFIEEDIKAVKEDKVKATLVNEDGASIYSASEIARKEFPDKDPTVRGAISIARRFQDPLAELVKIDPKSIGVGQYQHDVNQVRLKKTLEGVVESCVNFVGVDLNTASAPLLSFVSGIGPSVAGNIVKHREKSGGFKSREELLKVSRFSEKVFEQSAGFLRVYNGSNPLDATFIHPESYKLIEKWCKENKVKLEELVGDKELQAKFKSDKNLKEELGEFTHEDIYKSLVAPTQDPRTQFKSFEFRKGVKTMNDLKENDWYPGLVTNITQFGAFVDIGLKENGLIHISQMADKFVDDPFSVLKVGQEVLARVIEIDHGRKRIALSLKKTDKDAEYSAPSYQQNKSNKKPPAEQKIKNNAFAGLKNLKL